MGAFKKGQALFLYFMAYAVIGWIYEVFLEVVVYRWGFSNRGFLFGPYLPVYGFGAVIILLVLQSLKKKRRPSPTRRFGKRFLNTSTTWTAECGISGSDFS